MAAVGPVQGAGGEVELEEDAGAELVGEPGGEGLVDAGGEFVEAVSGAAGVAAGGHGDGGGQAGGRSWPMESRMAACRVSEVRAWSKASPPRL